MKIITWNCNMAFRRKWMSIIKFKPDILIIQECENESKYKTSELIPDYNEFIWIGDNINKGIGIISFNDYHVQLSQNYSKEFKYIVPLIVSGALNFNLFAIWAMPHSSKKLSYVGQIWNAVNYYKSDLITNSVLIGDWNSNAKWDHERPKGNHTTIVELLKKLNIVSVYHSLKKEDHGKEKEPTLLLLKNKNKPYHMDYCFVSQEMITNYTTIKVGDFSEWLSISDHVPLFIDRLIKD